MRLNPAVYDIWVFRRGASEPEFLLLRTSQAKADRHFGGGRFWQIPSDFFRDGEPVVAAIERQLGTFGLTPRAIWAAEHVYTIYNRRFDEMQIIGVYAAEVDASASSVSLNPEEHSEYEWLSYEAALARVHYRGLKDGLRSVQEYVTGVAHPARELQLR